MIDRKIRRQLESFGIWPLPEGWTVGCVDDLAKIGTGDKDTQNQTSEGKYPFYVRSQTIARIDSFSFDGVAVLTAGDGVGVGRVFHFASGRFDFHQRVYIICDFTPRLHANYFYEYFKQFFVRQVSRFNAKTSVDSVRREMIALMAVPLPPPREQKVISEILSTWERTVERTEKLIALKQQFKDAILANLLAQQLSGWKECKLGTLFENRKKKGTDGLPTYSITMDNGLVLRDSLERKNDTSLRPDEHLLIEKDDIAYNMMRMWQGASGLAPESGLVSPAYVVLRCTGDVDPLFASYLFKTPRVVKKFQDYSHGLTKDRLRLYYKDFASITLPVPPIDLQRKIANALAACDRELDCLQRKVAFLKLQKKGLMQQLLTGKIRVKLPKGAK